jgi:hypothetical protein
MNADSNVEPKAGAAAEPDEPLKRFTKDDLRKHLKEHPPQETQSAAAPSSPAPTSARVSLAAVLEPERRAPKLEPSFPRSFAKTPCKPNVDPQPKTKVWAVALVVVFFVGLGVYFVVKHHLDKNKPHVPPKNMPMKVIEGVMRP